MLCIQSFVLTLSLFRGTEAGNLRGVGAPHAMCMTSSDEQNNLYGLKGQPESSMANSARKQCQPRTCSKGHSIEPGLFGVNDGPMPYDLGLPSGYPKQLNSSGMGRIYKDTLGFTGVRNDESGLAFDIRCMFPVKSLSEIPNPDLDENWNWKESDRFFHAVVGSGFAPLLKLPVFEWNSPRITGLSYVGHDEQPHYLIKPHNFSNCSWPAVAPIITQIGDKLVKKIVDRYNKNGHLNRNHWKQGFAGIEIYNEWEELRCGPRNSPHPESMCEVPEGTSALEWENRTWTEACFGKPWTWNGHYWDGTPQQAWDFYVKAYALVKSGHPDVRIGGPAIATGPSAFPCGKYDGLGKWWVEGFLDTLNKSKNATVDFVSFHRYNNRENNDGARSVKYFYEGLKSSMAKYDITDVPILLTEYNAEFNVSKYAGFVGSMAGAAVNLAKLLDMTRMSDMKAAYVLDGRIGAYAPGNLYTYPINCHARNAQCLDNKSAEAVCEPEQVVIPEGVWEDCNATDMQTLNYVNPDNTCADHNNTLCRLGGAMATVFSDGRLSPFGAALSVLKHARNSRILPLGEQILSKLRRVNISAFAWQPSVDSRFASLLLTNTGDQNTGPLPGVSDLLISASRVVGASQIGQRKLTTSWTSDGIWLDGTQGLDTKGYLEGFVYEAAGFCDSDAYVLPALEPYQTVLLAVQHSDGCLCQELGPQR